MFLILQYLLSETLPSQVLVACVFCWPWHCAELSLSAQHVTSAYLPSVKSGPADTLSMGWAQVHFLAQPRFVKQGSDVGQFEIAAHSDPNLQARGRH